MLLCGGGSRMKGLETRLLRELTAAAPATVRPVRLCTSALLSAASEAFSPLPQTIVQSPEYMPENTLRCAPRRSRARVRSH